MSENLRAYTKTLYAMDGVVRRLKDTDWDKQSPNDDWTAKETLGHVIWGIKRIAASLNDDAPPAEQAEADVAGDQPAETWTSAMDNVLAALDQQGALTKMVETPFGEMTVDELLGKFIFDPLTHAWDIAEAAGIDAALPEDLAEKGIRILSALGDAIRGPGRFDDAIDIDDSASMADKFIAFTGRKP